MEKTANQIKADKWIETHFVNESETVRAIAHASYFSGLIDKQEEMRDGHAI